MHRGHALAGLAFSSALLIALAWFSGLRAAGLWQAIRSVPVWVYLPIAAAQAAIIALAALKWRLVIARTDGANLTMRDATAATAIGTLAGQVMPIQLVTPLARAWVADRAGIAPGRAIGASLLEQSFEILALVCMALAALITSAGTVAVAPAIAISAVAAAAMTLLVGPALGASARLSGIVAAKLRGRAQGAFAKLAIGFTAASRLPRKVLVQLTCLSLLRYTLLASLNVLLLGMLVPDVDSLTLLLAFPLVLLVMSLPIFPGGLGILEITWAGVLVASGHSPAVSAEAALALRIVSTSGFFLVAPFLIALLARSRVRPA